MKNRIDTDEIDNLTAVIRGLAEQIKVLKRQVTGNRIVDSDSYKASHWLQYPPKTTGTFSYLESRGCDRGYEASVFFGLQYILKSYFATPITMEEVEGAKTLIEAHGEPFNYDGWKLLVTRHGGKLPLRIRAVPEGTVVPLHNALMTVETTDPDFYWLASYVETALMRVWYPITVATQSYYLRKLIYKYLDETSDNADEDILFMLHDFGSRGGSSRETVGIGGLAHLITFRGTDTMRALEVGRDFYNIPVAGFSIPAGEHSTFSSWGKEHEADAYRNMLDRFAKPGKMLAVVSDTWNIYNACEHIWGEELKQEVIDSGAKVVIRPDSGDPVEVLCGIPKDQVVQENGKFYYKGSYKPYYDQFGAEVWGEHIRGDEVAPHKVKGVIGILAEKFGYTVTSKGYKVLKNVGIIQGDGVNPDSIKQILERLKEDGWCASNVAFGMGGALLQKVDRDTLKMAYKCSSARINGRNVDVYKDPVTDPGKRSKCGRLDLVTNGKDWVTGRIDGKWLHHPASAMVTYFENGEILEDQTFEDIRQRASLTAAEKYDMIGK